ncbi:glucose-6-phosphate dehydrogenase [Halanaerobium praevalens]|uniref:Glucose-6-phosphate 1-dehydrogenase n=1 Tax=Halanaerobium praevalens (strain ATCC 33744 / DSM 2228 / GSL) TaxID=572479 RepID=E3DPC8_HALPG|nr:glucose-6-phosphate dehydrogenase [Halanaerobium praevalens]ADO76679.1 glucose-6-phosphate 1-dehydrogenase [Halanaerobium praevalens DSM 2228]
MNKTLTTLYQNLDTENIDSNFQFILFGGTGDLAHNKIIPAFYNLVARDILTNKYTIIATGRRYKNKNEYLAALYKSLKNKKKKIDSKHWKKLASHLEYFQLSFKNEADFKKLENHLVQKDKTEKISERIFYLATAPKFFAEIAKKLDKFNLLNAGFKTNNSKLVIEKPFGHDFKSAQKLNNTLSKIFSEKNIFRIDHYLGKEMIQNIMVIRLSNPIFRALWNKEHIDNIQIYLNESEGVKDRGKYYDDTGVIKDMFQNHILQILSLITMEEPENLSAAEISQKKVEVFKELADNDLSNIDEHIVRGQYSSNIIENKNSKKSIKAYREEKEIDPNSKTATFMALKLFLNNQRWQDVPIYLKSGKRLNKKEAAIAIEFKDDFHAAYTEDQKLSSNILLIKIQPEEGVSLRFNTRKPASNNKIVPVEMEFCQSCQQFFNSPENYEGLIYDMIAGDKTLFTSWEEVSYSWKFIDKIQKKCQEQKIKLHSYPAQTGGPKAADKLLEADNRIWQDKK